MSTTLQIGFLNWFSFLVVAVLFACGVVYFGLVPSFAFWKMTKTWKHEKITFLFSIYFTVTAVSGLAFWYLPNYFMKTYYWDIVHSVWHRAIGVVFFSAPLVFMGTVFTINNVQSFLSKRAPQSRDSL